MAKIYVISDKPEFCIMASNMINATGNSAIISELDSFSEEAVFKDIKDNLSTYDFFLVFKGGANLAAARASRINGLTAAACRDSDEVDEIFSDGNVNGIFIDSVKVGKKGAADIVDELLQNVGGKRAAKEPAKTQHAEPVQKEQVVYQRAKKEGGGLMGAFSSMTSKITSGGSKKAEKPAKRSESPGPQNDFIKSVKSKGIEKAMKDALGITDEGGD